MGSRLNSAIAKQHPIISKMEIPYLLLPPYYQSVGHLQNTKFIITGYIKVAVHVSGKKNYNDKKNLNLHNSNRSFFLNEQL